ncbi:MAG: 50S ribosomal protein L20 [Candidatus Nealsonbacteria bacterium]
MVRIKKGVTAHKHKKHLLEHAKGFRWGRKSKFRAAKDALRHAWEYSFRDRKVRKREKRGLWQVQINAACREAGLNYSKFASGLRKNKIELDRKVLAQLCQDNPDIFKKIMEKAKN